MENLKTINEFLLEKFNDDVQTWFDIIIDNNKQWVSSDILKYVEAKPTLNSFTKLVSYVSSMSANLPGKPELMTFLENVKSKAYKSEFRNFDGNSSVILETFSLLKQALVY